VSKISQAVTTVAIAILYRDDGYLMQLRDDVPGILYPGCWGLFGGHVEPGEHPDEAVRRELAEEIGYVPPQLTLFETYADDRVARHVYQGCLEVSLTELVLGEGWDMDILTKGDIKRGEHYSARAQQIRPLGSPHQQILLDFINTHQNHD